jgi:long-chain acyl-CoA synthetase
MAVAIGDDITLVDRLYQHGRERWNEPALQDPYQLLTWGELDAFTNRVANALIAAEVKKGGRVALLADTNARTAALLLGILKAGGSAVPVPTLISPDAIARVIEDSGASVLLVSQSCIGLLTEETLGLKCLRVATDFDDPEWTSLNTFLGGANALKPDVRVGSDDEFNIIYSSGTTGRPKGIVHDHALRTETALSLGPISFPPGSRTLTTTSLYSNWTMNALVCTLWAGGCVRFLGKFSAAELVRVCREFSPETVYLVPVQIGRILEDSPSFLALKDLAPAMKWCAGSYLSAGWKKALLDNWRGGLIEVYGMTEGTPFTVLRGHERPDKLHTVGQSDPPEDLKIIDDAGNERLPGERGEIVGRVRTVMKGYNNDDDATQALFWHDKDGIPYFRSGDIGSLDEENFLQVTDRKKDMIISGGFNVYSSDLEEILLSHPSVAEAAVFGVPSHKWGETPAAVVVLKAGATVAASELLVWANERLGRLQRLAAIALADQLPRGGLDKVLKRQLRETHSHLGDRLAE